MAASESWNEVSAEEGPLRAFAVAVASGLAVFLIGTGIWAALLYRTMTHPPAFAWPVPAMAAILACGVAYLQWGRWPGAGRLYRRAGLRFHRVSLRAFLLSLAFGWSAMLSGFALYAVWRQTQGLGGETPYVLPHLSPFVLYPMLVMAGIVPGAVEEIAMRGFIQGGLERRFGLVPALVVTGLVFALIHTNHAYFRTSLMGVAILVAIFFAVSTMLGAIARLTDSVIPGIVVHAGFDAVYFVVLGAMKPGVGPIGYAMSLAPPPVFLVVAAIAAICAAAALTGLYRSTRPR